MDHHIRQVLLRPRRGTPRTLANRTLIRATFSGAAPGHASCSSGRSRPTHCAELRRYPEEMTSIRGGPPGHPDRPARGCPATGAGAKPPCDLLDCLAHVHRWPPPALRRGEQRLQLSSVKSGDVVCDGRSLVVGRSAVAISWSGGVGVYAGTPGQEVQVSYAGHRQRCFVLTAALILPRCSHVGSTDTAEAPSPAGDLVRFPKPLPGRDAGTLRVLQQP
jgi:hypothetical protein